MGDNPGRHDQESALSSFLRRMPYTMIRETHGLVRHLAHTLPARLEHIERIIMSAAEDLAARIDTATSEVAAELSSARDALAAAIANQGSNPDQVAQAVQEALDVLNPAVTRLEAMGADPANPDPPVESTRRR